MLSKIVAVLALAASCGVISIEPNLAASQSSPWYDTNSNAAQSRANLKEQVLTPSAATKITYLRSVVSPLIPPNTSFCSGSIVAPVLVGGYLYAITNAELSKYNAATGSLIWRSIPDPAFTETYRSLAISGSLVIVGASDCTSESQPPGTVYAVNASTGALVWTSLVGGGGPLYDAVVAGSYVITEGVDSSGSVVAVLNLSDGKPVWNNGGCGGASSAVVVALVVMSYGCGAQGASLDANNLASGALLWSLPGNWVIQRGDLSGSAGKHFYATDSSGNVVDLNPLTGQVEYSLSQAVNVLAVDTSRVYATCGSQGSYVCAYNISTGALQWQDPGASSSSAIAAEADGVLYLDTGEALNAATGQGIATIWEPFNNPPATAIAVGDGRIAVVTDPRVLDLFGLPGY